MGSRVLPFLFSRRIIPKQFAAVRIELMGKQRSIRSDKENSFTVVGKTRAESVTREPYPHIPDLFEFVDNCLKRGASVRAEETRNIFQDNPCWSNFSSQCRKGEE
jgi:hypothetical protein